MYVPPHFNETDSDELIQLIERYPFGSLVTSTGDEPFASHVPFIHDEGTLLCHLARANPQVELLRASAGVLCMFLGPHAYVSPSWYESSGVPTWNYAAVHVHGTASLVEDPAALAPIVDGLARRFESAFEVPWEPVYDERMLAGIVGVRILPTAIQGKFKLSQNKSATDRRRVAAALEAAGDDLSRGLAALMQARTPRDS